MSAANSRPSDSGPPSFWFLLRGLVLIGVLLAGCGPAGTATPVAARARAAAPPAAPLAATAMPPATVVPPPTALPEPTATLPTPTATGAQPTDTRITPEEPEQSESRRAVSLTILHTNDVGGEIDPCG